MILKNRIISKINNYCYRVIFFFALQLIKRESSRPWPPPRPSPHFDPGSRRSVGVDSSVSWFFYFPTMPLLNHYFFLHLFSRLQYIEDTHSIKRNKHTLTQIPRRISISISIAVLDVNKDFFYLTFPSSIGRVQFFPSMQLPFLRVCVW